MKIFYREEFKKYLYFIAVILGGILMWMHLEGGLNSLESSISSQPSKDSMYLEGNLKENKPNNEKENKSSKENVDPFRERITLQNSYNFNPPEPIGEPKNITVDPFKERLKQQSNDAKFVTVSPFGEINK